MAGTLLDVPNKRDESGEGKGDTGTIRGSPMGRRQAKDEEKRKHVTVKS